MTSAATVVDDDDVATLRPDGSPLLDLWADAVMKHGVLLDLGTVVLPPPSRRPSPVPRA
jgi:hypothetical protein